MYSLFASDLDDTLLSKNGVLSQANISAALEAQSAGCRLCIITGRMYKATVTHARALGINGPVAGYHGGIVVDSQSGDTLYYRALEQKAAQKALLLAEEWGIYAQYYSADDYYFYKPTDESASYEMQVGHAGIALGRVLSQALDIDPAKILLIGDPSDIRRLYPVMQQHLQGQAAVAISNPTLLEITHPEANKGTGLAAVARYYGIPMAQTVAIGDGINDLPMIRAAGLGLAVGNAAPELKAEAAAVMQSCENDGFAQAIRQYILSA